MRLLCLLALLALLGLLTGCGDSPPAVGDSPAAANGRRAAPEQTRGRSMAETQNDRSKGR